MVVQSVLIPKTLNIDYAFNWLKDHNFIVDKVDITDKFFRFRQIEPNAKNKYFTKVLDNGIELIIAV